MGGGLFMLGTCRKFYNSVSVLLCMELKSVDKEVGHDID